MATKAKNSKKPTKKAKSKKRTNAQSKARKVYLTLLALFIGGFFAIQLVRLYQKNEEYIQREEALTQELEALEEEQEALEQQEEYVSTWEYIEKIARQKLGLFFDNEIIFREE